MHVWWPCASLKRFLQIFERSSALRRIYYVSAHLPRAEELRAVIKQKGFRVKTLAVHVGLDVRTLERRFAEQFHTTPKRWIVRERMCFASPLLAEGLSNKEVAASLGYTCEANFCRDFKRHFGCAPQKFARNHRLTTTRSRFDKELSRSDNRLELLGLWKSQTLEPADHQDQSP
jgi:AraC-like DNA-binding protein